MNELVAGGGSYMLPALFGIAVVFFCVVVFISMRRAVRANDQILLLEASLREQRKQTKILQQLVELSCEPEVVEPRVESVNEQPTEEPSHLTFRAER
ncbi:YebO-like protein [Rosenbergiella nectarea]|uniref:YebO-like protein n=1 Tax=Rosenbergiella nectarea TaxID=988801 RepID=A0A1H9I0V7_9GAMM|nr:YebO family protein [Rosenbergiella nectarea]SEQ68250.1 YebO-like protein [Rosenbergiella nectarea]